MKKYEIMFILDSNLEEAARKELIESLLNVLKANGGTISNVNEWGNRELAYVIEKHTHGYYVVVNLQTENTAAIKEFERLTNINANVIRQLTISL
jgi:small subunit ribosomal protein S6